MLKASGVRHRQSCPARRESSPVTTAQTCSDITMSRSCWISELQAAPVPGVRFTEQARNMRVFARRERPHPGAQLTLLEARDGWRYILWATSLPARTPRVARPVAALSSTARDSPHGRHGSPAGLRPAGS